MFNWKKRSESRQTQRDFFDKTQENINAGRRDLAQGIKKNTKTKASPEWHYKAPPLIAGLSGATGIVVGIQLLFRAMNNLNRNNPSLSYFEGLFHDYGYSELYILLFLLGVPITYIYLYVKLKARWTNDNAMFLTDDIEEYANDSYVRTFDHMTQEFDMAPDAGLGFDGHASSIVGHGFIDNNGINPIDMPLYDPTAEGQVALNEDGTIKTKRLPMFDKGLGELLFSMSNVPKEHQIWYDATDYEFNPVNTRDMTVKERAKYELDKRKGKDTNAKRTGAHGRAGYDTVADYINGEFYVLDTETQRPAGVYFYDSRPVNTILIAITRGGKGQTYIEPAFDIWTREKNKWNIFTTDPKGELLAKFYYPATKRGMDVIQFNLMHPHLTNVFNPLANAIQQFRKDDPTKGTAIVDTIIETLFPDNGEIWNPAAGNMFRRAIYMLFDYYIEQEKYLRYIGHRDKVAQEIIDQEIDTLYGKVTLFNTYTLIGDLASKVSKDEKFINVNPAEPPVSEKDLLTLMFDAMAMLPNNAIRSKAITANNAIKQVANAQQTIAGIYATLLTGLSVYADDTAIALMSGSLSESFDITGLGFPRRVGIRFDTDYVRKFRIANELARWTCYKDSNFTERYEGSDFEHDEKIPPSNWSWSFFAGKFEQDVSYIRLEIFSGSTVAKQFNFRFTKGYKTFDNISYVIDPITHQKIISGGTLEEWDITAQKITVSMFNQNQFNYKTRSYQHGQKPILSSNQVYYSERPKFVFAITPPHLQVYQKHILVIIKQILDEQYSMSYVTKENRKPIIGTRLMLEEFGNIRSGENGIPDIDTATSIALGQDVQITFVLQSFQQFRAIYGEDKEKIIRANSANTVFLKSNDEELINDLVRMSGTKHDFRMKSKSISRKLGDVINMSEPLINYSGEHGETTALVANDFLFLAGKSPGNSITLISGEMPIVNKLATITPMAAGLHKRLPQQRTKSINPKKPNEIPDTQPYSDSTMPTTNAQDGINYLDNIINGEDLVRARVEQAKIAQDIAKTVLEISKEHNISVNPDNGDLSDLMMNLVYEEYDSQVGNDRRELATSVSYHDLSVSMTDDIISIRDPKISDKTKIETVTRLREHLVRCALDENLDELTAVYRDKKSNNILGYDLQSISVFVGQLGLAYPAPEPLVVETIDIDKEAEKDPNYRPYELHKEMPFDAYNYHYLDALEDLTIQILDGSIDTPEGVTIVNKGDETEMRIGNTLISSYQLLDNSYTFTINENYSLLSKVISENQALVQLVQSVLMENNN